MTFHKNKMQDTNMIGDTAKERRIDYGLIDRLNKECEAKARKAELEGRLAGKRKKKEEEKPIAEPTPTDNITYIQTPDGLRDIHGVYSLQKGIYEIDFDIIVPSGKALILLPGIKLYFTKDAGITCEGRFETIGKNGLEVLLTAKDKTKGWKDVYLGGPAKAIMDYTRISYGSGRQNRGGDLNGGAIYVNSSNGIKPELIVNNCIFEDNSCLWHGGAIYNNRGNVTIGKNNRFENNFANLDGGAIYNHRGNVTIAA